MVYCVTATLRFVSVGIKAIIIILLLQTKTPQTVWAKIVITSKFYMRCGFEYLLFTVNDTTASLTCSCVNATQTLGRGWNDDSP